MFQKMVRVKTKPPRLNARMLLEVADQLPEEADEPRGRLSGNR